MERLGAITAAFIAGCASAPRERAEVLRGTHPDVRLVFATGPSWWTDPDKECPVWSAALPIARRMAGCSKEYVGDPAHKCQAPIRKCSPGCDICRNLKPGEGPDTDFGSVIKPRAGPNYASTLGPLLFGGHYTRFDQTTACHDAWQLARVTVHEAAHACRGAGGSKVLYDSDDFWKRAVPGCFLDEIAPVTRKIKKECGDLP